MRAFSVYFRMDDSNHTVKINLNKLELSLSVRELIRLVTRRVVARYNLTYCRHHQLQMKYAQHHYGLFESMNGVEKLMDNATSLWHVLERFLSETSARFIIRRKNFVEKSPHEVKRLTHRQIRKVSKYYHDTKSNNYANKSASLQRTHSSKSTLSTTSTKSESIKRNESDTDMHYMLALKQRNHMLHLKYFFTEKITQIRSSSLSISSNRATTTTTTTTTTALASITAPNGGAVLPRLGYVSETRMNSSD